MEKKSDLYRWGIRLIVVTKPVSMDLLFKMLMTDGIFHLQCSISLIIFKSPRLLLLFNCPVMSDIVIPWTTACQGLCPSPSPEVCPSLCSMSQWCHPAISSSDTLISFCPQSSQHLGTFPMSQLFASDDQNTGVSASASVLPMSIQGWSLKID